LQHLSSHSNPTFLADDVPDADFSPFWIEEDEFIVSCVNRLGNPWISLSQVSSTQFNPRDCVIV
jgi:hypothetical protein